MEVMRSEEAHPMKEKHPMGEIYSEGEAHSMEERHPMGEAHPMEERQSMEEVHSTDKEERCGICCHQKATPRQERELKQLKNRLNRMAGQLNGIGKMLDENRYCGDILTQVAAVESALQSFAYIILREHMETCVVEEIRKGNFAVVEEAVELMKKLK